MDEERKSSATPGLRLPPIEIPMLFWEEMLFMSREALPNEYSGLGRLSWGEKQPILLEEVLYFPQANTGASTDLKLESVAAYLSANPEKSESVRFWWHSHARMECFWSGTDTDTIRRLLSCGGWVLSLVVNALADFRMRLDIGTEFGPMTFDNLQFEPLGALSLARKAELRGFLASQKPRFGTQSEEVSLESRFRSLASAPVWKSRRCCECRFWKNPVDAYPQCSREHLALGHSSVCLGSTPACAQYKKRKRPYDTPLSPKESL